MPWDKQYNEADVLDRAMKAFWTKSLCEKSSFGVNRSLTGAR